ncbi:DUF4199 domain-containing protein [Sphingobacterium olei]|uniref:DUF4199 domain-containing protein n=1 Tax=Sphingobacterium olei TaxID=2571155 RepID=A0A4U0NE05_9SPHI|nr:DUF4199 domain-containing protein [Sphingobacterium olei]TJZ51762.1 DUF4199 domain-containing protein [Sphingobacterium olei]
MNDLSTKEKRNGLIYGAVVGVISIILSVLSIYYTRNAETYSNLYIVSTILKILGSIAVPVFFVYLLRRSSGGDWIFSKALKSIYILLAASIVVSSLGITIYQKTMDKVVLEESYQNLMNLKIVEMEEKGASNEEIDQQMEVIEQDREFAFSPMTFRNTIPPIFISLLLNFIFALILALLFRDNTQKVN